MASETEVINAPTEKSINIQEIVDTTNNSTEERGKDLEDDLKKRQEGNGKDTEVLPHHQARRHPPPLHHPVPRHHLRENEGRNTRKKKKKKRETKRHRRTKYDSWSEEESSKLFRMDDKENQWKLDENLANYIQEHTVRYTTDKDLDILEGSPVPNNITETLKLDQTLETLLREKGPLGTKAMAKDKSLARISSKIRDILGPLTKIWQRVEKARSGKETTEFDLDDVALKFQHTMLLIGQALNATTFYRRKSTLTALGVRESDVNTWLRDTYTEDLKHSDSHLFGEKCIKSLTKQAKATNKSLKQLLMPIQSRQFISPRRKPFSGGSSQYQPSSRRGGEPPRNNGTNNSSMQGQRGGSNGRRGRGRGRGSSR